MAQNPITPEATTPQVRRRLVEAMHQLEAAEALDKPAAWLDRAAHKVAPPGPASDALTGKWLGHALHPLLTDIPLGTWTSASLLDLLGGKGSRRASQRLVGLGIVAAVPTAASGLAEWVRVDTPARRVGTVHAFSNTAALMLYLRSYLARRRGQHGRGIALGIAGGLVASAAGYLGGHLTLARKAGYRDPSFAPGATTPPAERGQHGEITEPPNSTVDDWLGQQVGRDQQVVDELLDETGGDVREAERRFPSRSHEDRPDRLPTERRRT